MALALQREGFSVLQLAYFGAPGTPDSLERIPLELFDRGLAWLGAQPGVDAQRLTLVGGSKGAEAVLLVATRHPDLRAVVAGMPTSVAWNGINWQRGGQSESSSWTSGGQEVPTMPFASWNQAEGVISVYRSIEDPALGADAERAAIPIERARAATMLICGEAETMWPACPMSRAVAARAAERGGPQVHVLAYADAGHLVFGPPIARDNAFYRRLAMLGGSVEGNAAARADSWPRIITFLRDSTTPPPLLAE
jgi:dienelactone hydrolase